MWELVQVLAEGADETLGEYDTEDEALSAGKEAEDFSEALYVVRRDGEIVWSNQAGAFERI